jgi:hypothetical protein
MSSPEAPAKPNRQGRPPNRGRALVRASLPDFIEKDFQTVRSIVTTLPWLAASLRIIQITEDDNRLVEKHYASATT